MVRSFKDTVNVLNRFLPKDASFPSDKQIEECFHSFTPKRKNSQATVGLSVKDMAENMGHSPEIHMNKYQRWLTLENREITYDAALARYESRLAEKTEVERLREQLVAMESTLQETQLINSQLHSQLENFSPTPDAVVEELKAEIEALRAENQRAQQHFIELAAKTEQVEM